MLPTVRQAKTRKGKNAADTDDGRGFMDELGDDEVHGQGDIFRSIELEGSDKRPDYMPFDRIHFPRITRETTANPTAELDSMWMIGFVHNDAEEGPQGETAKLLREYESKFAKKKGAGAEARARKKREREIRLHEEGDKVFTKEEKKRMEELERMFARDRARARAKKRAEETGTGVRKRRRPRPEDRLKNSAYAHENKKLRRVLQLRSKEGKKQMRQIAEVANEDGTQVRSAALENLAYLERLEQRAAVMIQRAFRRFMRVVFWRKYLQATAAATDIQRCVRGFLIRQLVRSWVAQRERMVTKVQGVIRGKQTRDALLRQKKFEEDAALDIQRAARGFLVRWRLRNQHEIQAATKLAAVWRGVRDRGKTDKIYLDRQVTRIQAVVRGYLQWKRFQGRFQRESAAAGRVQALFRGYRARMRRNELLWQRETGSRQQWMALLRAEEKYLDQELQRRLKQRARVNLERQWKELATEWQRQCDRVLERDFDFLSLHYEREKLSPRAIQQGWAQQLKQDVEQQRKLLTQQKSRALFTVAREERRIRRLKREEDERLEDLLRQKREVELQWADERVLMWRRENERNWAERRVNATKNAAEERRRWQVTFYTDSGKPNLRRLGPTNDLESIVPSHQLTIAHGDITALTRTLPPLEQEEEDAARTKRLQLEHAWMTHAHSMLGDAPTAWDVDAPGGFQALEEGRPPSTVSAAGHFVGFQPQQQLQLRGESRRSQQASVRWEERTRAGSIGSRGIGSGRRSQGRSRRSWDGAAMQGPQRIPGEESRARQDAEVQEEEEEEDPDGWSPRRSAFDDAVRLARTRQGPAPSFLLSGLHSGAAQGEERSTALARRSGQRGRWGNVEDGRLEQQVVASLPPGLMGARRGEAAALIATSRIRGTVGHTSVVGRRHEQRRVVRREMEEFERMGKRVQALAEKVGAVSGQAEMVQYGALLKPLFANMETMLTRLKADPVAAAATHGLPSAPNEPRIPGEHEVEMMRAVEPSSSEESDGVVAEKPRAQDRGGKSKRKKTEKATEERQRAARPKTGALLGFGGGSSRQRRRVERDARRVLGTADSEDDLEEAEERDVRQAIWHSSLGATNTAMYAVISRVVISRARGLLLQEEELGFDVSGVRDYHRAVLEPSFRSERDTLRRLQKRKKKKSRFETAIPWSLLDELEAEKVRKRCFWLV